MEKVNNLKRFKLHLRHPNPLFENWLEEWRKEAEDQNSSDMYRYRSAIQSLDKYPLVLKQGAECIVLEGFDSKLCKKLDAALEKYRCENPSVDLNSTNILNNLFEHLKSGENDNSDSMEEECDKLEETEEVKKQEEEIPRSPVKIKRNTKEYIPAKGTGAYALLITLFENICENGSPGKMDKNELIKTAQHLCVMSFTISGPGSRYSAWSSMGNLIKKGLVIKTSSSAKYNLTEPGIKLAKKLKDASNFDSCVNYQFSQPISLETKDNKPHTLSSSEDSDEDNILKNQPSNQNKRSSSHDSLLSNASTKVAKSSQIENSESVSQELNYKPRSQTLNRRTAKTSQSCTSSQVPSENFIMIPGSFKVILLVDTAEKVGTKRSGIDITKRELAQMKVPHEVRHLTVGDFAWICKDTSGRELLLPYIVERKRMDDLSQSIKDGRFHEQKFRLKRLQVQQKIYIVESYKYPSYLGLPITTLMQAACNTQLVDGFIVKHTNNLNHSMKYLAVLTQQFIQIFKDKTLLSCNKEELPPFDIKNDIISLMTFSDFSRNTSKKRKYTAREMFVKQLLQLRGLSVEKAKALVDLYPSPRLLREELYRSSNENVLSRVSFGPSKNLFGPVLSKVIYNLYTSKEFS